MISLTCSVPVSDWSLTFLAFESHLRLYGSLGVAGLSTVSLHAGPLSNLVPDFLNYSLTTFILETYFTLFLTVLESWAEARLRRRRLATITFILKRREESEELMMRGAFIEERHEQWVQTSSSDQINFCCQDRFFSPWFYFIWWRD